MTVVGCGAAGNNAALNLALSGVGELRFIDPDFVEPSNLTRSPLFRPERLGGRTRHKACEIALGALAYAYAREPVARYAVARVEALGLGALQGSHAVVAAVDSMRIRALLGDATRLLGIPLVEIGFLAPRGHVTVFPNRSAEEPDWCCLHPPTDHGGLSCSLYARAVEATGRIAATQTVASTFGSLATEAVIQALHGEFPLGGRLLELDVRSGASRTLELALDPRCAGAHRRWGEVRRLDAHAGGPLTAVFDALRGEMRDPVVRLPAPFVVEVPCAACGHAVRVGRPAWALTEPPVCRKCPETPTAWSHVISVTEVSADDPLAARHARTLGLAPGSIVEVFDRATEAWDLVAVQLAGGVEDLFLTRRRSARPSASPVTPDPEADAEPALAHDDA